MRGTWVQALVLEIPHAAEQQSPCATTTEAHVPRAHAPQQEKPPQWEALRTTKSSPHSLQLEETRTQQQRSNAA